MSVCKKVIVYGGCGGLGSVIVSSFKNQGWWVCSVDLKANDDANESIKVDPAMSWTEQEAVVLDAVKEQLKDDKADAVINMAGGWAGGCASSNEFIKNADLMWKQSVWSSGISAAIAAKHLKEGGCVVLPGAQPALKGTPGMMGYGMAKAAVHQLVKSLASDKSGLPPNVFTAALLPVTLDTPMNRKFMPKADFSSWTKCEHVADILLKWSSGTDRPVNGSLVQLITKSGETSLVIE